MSDQNNDEKSETPDPITFMRSRHPDLYSDSETVSRPELTEDILEYRLQTLTSRNQETEFAYFARRLAQKEICPNLRPQTGPVGGGDSKVDSETIPVSSDVADVWVGADPAAANEPWAFAFSAKEDWKSKVAEDVKKIAGTNRGYKRIYFITNQFVRDKSRAESEDSLTKEFGISVKILDRSWITAAVFERGREDLAIEALHIESLRTATQRKVGPADLERQQELDDLEKAIADPEFYAGAQYQLFEDCLRAALLARGLGRPRTEIDGLFIRAQRIAEKSNDDRQRLRVAYNYAWTVIFWFDDYNQLNQVYDQVAALALKSNISEETERAANLWMVLASQVQRGILTKESAKLDERRAAIIARLDELAAQDARPNNALQAKTSRVLIEVHDAMFRGDRSALDAAWKTLQQIVKDSEPLGDYPFDRLPALAQEFAAVGAESAEFDTLFELLIAAFEKRKGEATGAELLNNRGFSKLEANQPYEAISLLGRAMERFIKREHRGDLIFSLMGLSQAYHQAGLLWAARSCALAATERCFAYFREDGTIVGRSILCLQQLERMELLLGRIPHLLMAMELEAVLVPQLNLKDKKLERQQNNWRMTEGMLGILMLTASIDQLKRMQDLPEALEQMGLFIPKACLMHALGYTDELIHEGFPTVEEAQSFMKLAYEQPGRLQLPSHPQIDDGQSVTYRTNVLGCEVNLLAPANAVSISVAEAILGSIEAFLATSLNERIMPYRSSARIILRPAFDLKKGLSVSEEADDAGPHIVILHPFAMPEMTPENRSADRDGLTEVIARFLAHIAVIENPEQYLEKIAGEERGFARALIYSEASLAQENLYGKSPKVLIGDWKPEGDAQKFPLVRTAEWTTGIEFEQRPLPDDDQTEDAMIGDIDAARRASFMHKMQTGKHSERQIASLIDVPLWNRASWCGTMFMFDPTRGLTLALGFEDRDAAGQIFKGLKNQLGDDDKENKLRILIVRGVNKEHPAWYRVTIGTQFDRNAGGNTIVMMVTRQNLMEAASTEGLDGFLAALKESRDFLLVPAQYNRETGKSSIGFRLGIRKTELIVRNAWDIEVGEQDIMGLSPNDDPITPDGVEDPPCRKTLAYLQSMKRN